jgi:hypothetical protein
MDAKVLMKKELAFFAGCILFGITVLPGLFVVVVVLLRESRVILGPETYPSVRDIPWFYKSMFVYPVFRTNLLIFGLFPYVVTQIVRGISSVCRRVLAHS